MNGFSDDDHPYIIKMPDEPPTSKYGLGYEIFHSMKKHENNIAQVIVETKEKQTYGQLLDKCIRVAINLRSQNLSDDDIIGLCVGNSKDSLVGYIAGLFLGNRVTALDPGTSPSDKASMLRRVTPKIIFVDDDALRNIEESLKIAELNIKLIVNGKNGHGHSILDEYLVSGEEDVKNFQPVEVNSINTTAVIFFSSGTSGESKGICISHQSLLTRTDGGGMPTAIIFAQLNWISFALFTIRALRTGSARILVDHFEMNNLWNVIEEYKVVLVFVSVFQVAEFANYGRPKDIDISSLKLLMTGGCVLPSSIFEKMREILPEVLVVQAYGLTEIGGPALVFDLNNPEHVKWQQENPSSCGTPINGVWYKVVDPETEELLGPNKPGELRMKSKLQMLGYHNMDCSECFDSNNWYKSGDIVQYNENRCFFVVDRMKDMMKYRCWTISSTTLEHVLMEHPAVDKAVVIGVPHDVDCDHPMGIVTLKKNCHVDSKELEKYVEDRVLDRQRLRKGVKIVEQLPMNSSGKILKRVVRQMVLHGAL